MATTTKAAATTATSSAAAATTTTSAAATSTTSYMLPVSSSAADGSATYYLPTGTTAYTNLPTTSGTTGSGTDSKSNLPTIVGAAVGGVIVLAVLGLLLQRYRSRSRSTTINSHQSRNQPRHNQTAAAGSGIEEDRGDRAKLAKSFTIRRPPSVYVEDDQDLDMTGHPRYKSAGDALNHPYYGDRSVGVVEYELTDTNGQKYGPGSVAERKQYVELQQRKVMDEYEMSNHPHMYGSPPSSPYPASHATSAPSYTSGALSPTTMRPLSPMSPSMGGRSPRVNHPPSPYGRTIHQQQQDEYMY
ncbi:hypothetical protein EDD21DRAFT_364357 [Dissophora ornata]|nr:hypothetical protein BGZ58_005947 [Dissophora ornata]KAI8605107.1 hypothetical protein EDD21DRAFT_364357 [Dissophora ornata]